MTSWRNRFFGCRVARARRKAIRTFNGRPRRFSIDFSAPRQTTDRRGRRRFSQTCPDCFSRLAGERAREAARRVAGRARWLVWRGLAKQASCADSGPQRRGRRQRGRDRCAASPSLPSPCSLPLFPPLSIFPHPRCGGLAVSRQNRAGRSSVRCAQAASPDRFSWRRPRFCRFAQAAWAPPSRAKAGQTKNGRLARWRQPAVTGSSDAGAGVSWRSSWPLPRLRFPSLSPLVLPAGGGGPRTGSRS